MHRITRAAVAAFALAAMLVALGGTASAASKHFSAPVFVQTDNPAGNQVVAYDRAANGTLTQAGVYNTGGKGGVLEGAVVDNLASQGSLAYDREHQLLLAVNAGSNSVSVFRVDGDRLSLRQVIGSGGSFPASIAVRHGLVFVLNAEGQGSVQGYFILGNRLVPLPGSNRNLGLSATQTPRFTSTPGQVAFSPDGRQLLVTTKGNGSAIDVFRIKPLGRLAATPVVNSLPGEVPFALTFDARGRLLVAEAGTNALASFTLNADGTVTKLDAVGTGQAATCWVVGAGGFFYTSNAGSGSLSRFQEALDGGLALLGNTATHGGTVDATITPDGRFLYAQTGGEGLVDEFKIGPGGSLSPIGSLAVPGAVGGEGIVSL
jgi:6-phosphogluconolactonase (cycloisomerase 2 family)